MSTASDDDLPDLDSVVIHAWQQLRTACPSLPKSPNIRAAYYPMSTNVLGSATHTMFSRDSKWVSSIMMDMDRDDQWQGVAVSIRINSNVQNGWYFSDSDSCDIGTQYDLKTVITHELMHGIGISSSITDSGVGYTDGIVCYPTLFDTLIRDNEGHVVDGCSMRRNGPYSVGGVSLYAPEDHNVGSSFSHHSGHGIMYYMIPSSRCLRLGSLEVSMLGAMGIQCPNFVAPVTPVTAAACARTPSLLCLLYLLYLLCVFLHKFKWRG